MKREKQDLIVRLPNWVGDVIMALPALRALEQIGLQLTLLGKPWSCDLLAGLSTTVLPISKPFWKSTHFLSSLPSKRIVLMPNSFSSALMAYFANKNAIGYKTDCRRFLLTESLKKQPGLHEVQYFWSLAHYASQYWFPDLQWPERLPIKATLPLPESSLVRAKNILLSAKIERPFWVVCPFAHGSGKNGQSKIWPYWEELTTHLRQQHTLIVCPSKQEEGLCSTLVPNTTILAGLNLSEYAAILSLANQVIANDSGPMHIAAAVGTNTLGIFGVSDPHRTRPWGAQYIGQFGCWPTVSDVIAQLTKV